MGWEEVHVTLKILRLETLRTIDFENEVVLDLIEHNTIHKIQLLLL